MLIKRVLYLIAILILLAAAGYSRWGSFWAVHDHPVEIAYVKLAMKMGSNPSLSSYSTAGLEMRHIVGDLMDRRKKSETDQNTRQVPITFPYEVQKDIPKSFDDWPSESNPFKYKPPMLPALMAYGHHQILGPKLTAYPLLDKMTDPKGHQIERRIVFDIQSWAVLVPYIAGLAVILLTFLLGWQLSGPGAGLLAAAMITTHPYQTLVATRVWPESVMTTFMLLTAMILNFFLKRHNVAGCFAAGIAYALAALTDPAALYALPALWVWTASAPSLSDRPILRKIFNPYFGAFLVGLCVFGQSWPNYTRHGLGGWMLSRSQFEPRTWILPFSEFVRTAAAFFIWVPPLMAVCRPRAEVRHTAFIALSLILMRWMHSPPAPWDERIWAVVMPFASLAAAPTLIAAVNCLFAKKVART